MQRLQNYTVHYGLQINRRKHTELAVISCGLTSWYLLCCLLRINYVTIHETHNWMFRCIYSRLKIISPYALLPHIAHSHPLTYHKRKLSSYLYIRLNAFSYVINSIPKFQRVSKRPASKVKRQKKNRERSVRLFLHDGKDEKYSEKSRVHLALGHELRFHELGYDSLLS
jgi:hypothetical protein